MKILVDENIPLKTVLALRDRGHDVIDIRGTPQQGIKDEPLWELAQHQGRLLITTDKGFTQHRDETHHGLLIIRLRQPNREKIHARVMLALAQFTESDWSDQIVVMRDAVRSVSQRKEK